MVIRKASGRNSSNSTARGRAVNPSSSRRKTKTDGAIRGGRGKYQFNLAKVRDVAAGTGYSTSHGGVVEGDRMLVGWIHKERGTGSEFLLRLFDTGMDWNPTARVLTDQYSPSNLLNGLPRVR